jgi:hypothetical protein
MHFISQSRIILQILKRQIKTLIFQIFIHLRFNFRLKQIIALPKEIGKMHCSYIKKHLIIHQAKKK